MKAIKSREDIKALQKVRYPGQYIAFIDHYFSRLMSVYGVDYRPNEEGYIILLEEGDPITEVTFLEERLEIRGGQTLETIIKEFVDYDVKSNLFDVLVIFSADFAMTYMIPNESWVGQELLQQLNNFQNYSGNNSEQ